MENTTRDDSKNFLVDNGMRIELINIENAFHSDEFVLKMAKRGLKEFKYAFFTSSGKNCMEFRNDWNLGKLEFWKAEKDGIRLKFYRNGNYHNSYVVPYEVGYKYIAEAK